MNKGVGRRLTANDALCSLHNTTLPHSQDRFHGSQQIDLVDAWSFFSWKTWTKYADSSFAIAVGRFFRFLGISKESHKFSRNISGWLGTNAVILQGSICTNQNSLIVLMLASHWSQSEGPANTVPAMALVTKSFKLGSAVAPECLGDIPEPSVWLRGWHHMPGVFS